MKNIFNISLTILIIYFSFYYTNMVSNYIKDKDPIMIKINSNKYKYEKNSQNAIINNNTIIPGISKTSIDINNSYLKMKRIKKYEESLLVFKYTSPDISILNNKDKIIINGNKNLNNISILLKIDNINILTKITKDKYLKNTNLNFIFTNNFIQKNYNYINTLNNNIVINQNDNLNNIELIDYCYTINLNETNKCLLYDKFIIFPTFISNNYYYNTYQLITNGNILAYSITNDKDITEIKLLINSIKNLGYQTVSLEELIKE